MNKFKNFSIIFIFCLINSHIYGQKVIEGTAHSIITDNLLKFATIAVFYNDSLITGGASDFDGKFTIIIPDSLPYVRLHLKYVFLYANDTIIDLHDKDTIRGKFYFGKRIPKYDLLFYEKDAKRDILDGDIKLYIHAVVYDQEKLNKITKKYGFRYVCITTPDVNQNLIESAYRYNTVIINYLNRINHYGWRKELDKKIVKKIKRGYWYPEDFWSNY
ncbi:MAG: hypothetical protein WAP17_08980 [Bacteroidales bacterium]